MEAALSGRPVAPKVPDVGVRRIALSLVTEPPIGRLQHIVGGKAGEKDKLKVDLAAGRYRFGLLTRITLKDGEEIDFWSARDALVLNSD